MGTVRTWCVGVKRHRHQVQVLIARIAPAAHWQAFLENRTRNVACTPTDLLALSHLIVNTTQRYKSSREFNATQN